MIKHKKILISCIITVFSLQAMGQKFAASFTPAASAESFTGRVFLYLSKDSRSPKDEMIGPYRFPCLSISVKNIKPNEKVVFDDAAIYYPVVLSDIERGPL